MSDTLKCVKTWIHNCHPPVHESPPFLGSLPESDDFSVSHFHRKVEKILKCELEENSNKSYLYEVAAEDVEGGGVIVFEKYMLIM